MYDSILLPFDGSEGAAETLHHASEIAHWADATICVLFVADTNRDSVTVVEDRVVDGLVKKGREIVDQATKTLDTLGVGYTTDVVQGNPPETIAEYAARYDHDLIVMSTHGREGVSRFLLGSVTEKVVRLSSVPVLTARMQPDEQLQFPYESILMPTDGSTAATHAAHHGFGLAESCEATVHLLSVVEEELLSLNTNSQDSDSEETQAATTAVDDLATEAVDRGLDTVTQVTHGSPAEEILDYVETHEIHAVVMGATGHRGTDRILFGSVAEKTVRAVPVPVVTVAESE